MSVSPEQPSPCFEVRESTRHVRVEITGVTVADTRRPRFLFEKGLPRRTYIPREDVRMDLLANSPTTSHCPYKGTAEYYSVTVEGTTHRDLVWSYPDPIPESRTIAGLLAFYDEHVDVFVDGLLEERPKRS